MKRNKVPVPGKMSRAGRWVVFWRDAGRIRQISVGRVSEKDAEVARQEVALALHGREWPSWACHAKPKAVDLRNLDRLAEAYRTHLEANCTPLWADTSERYVRLWLDFTAPGEATPADAQRFLDGFAGKAAGTRNKIRNCCAKFQRWAGAPAVFAGVQKIREGYSQERIAYFTRDERDLILTTMASDRGAVALWVAFYAGLRREEIARLEWPDIDLASGLISVRTSKTGRGRLVPIAARLAEVVASSRRGQGRVAPWKWEAGSEHWKVGALGLLERIQTRLPDLAARCRWNIFRHTFASLLVQSGVSIDKLSAWMGNSPDVCRRHYAQFIPAGARDSQIDLL